MSLPTRRWLACVMALAAAGTLAGHARQLPSPEGLFTPAEASRAAASEARSAEFRTRRVRVNTAQLGADHLTLNLSANVSLTAHRDRTAEDGDVWAGRVQGDRLSAVTFVRHGAIVQGAIRTADAAYSIEPIGEGPDHLIRQVDLQTAGGELAPLVPPATPAAGSATERASDRALDEDGLVDVLVLYTPAARQQAGGSEAAVKARIALGIAETNTAYANSAISHRLRLVGSELVGYRESGDLSDDLQRFTSTNDGVMDEVHARRNATGADLVTLIVGSTAGGACGVAWVMQNVSTGFAPYAFSVVAYPCISPNYTFAHELAHNLGTAHAPEDPNAPPAFPYAYGYKDPDHLFRTVMAYDCPGGCPRVLHFSNPSSTFSGKPTGTPALQDNALALNQTTPTGASFRPARSTWLGQPRDLTVETRGRDATVSWSRPDSGTPTHYVVEVGRDEGLSDVATFIVPATATTFLHPQVDPGSYHIRVRAHDDAGPGAPSASTLVVMTSTGRCEMPASAPMLLDPVEHSGGVTLSWEPESSDTTTERYLIGAGTRPQQVDSAVIDTASPATSATVTAAPGLYFVRVAGVNPCGIGAPSNEVVVAVGPPIPGPPADLSARVEPAGLVTLTWRRSVPGGAPTSFIVEAGSAPGRADIALLPAADTMLFVNATPGRYYVRVRAVNEHGRSAVSNEIIVDARH